jgi:drug/metabolite transporter (DMT)-like permease
MDDRTGTDTAAAEAGGRSRAAAQRREAPAIPAADRLKAIGLMCLAVALFSGLDTSAKYLVTQGNLPVVQIVWSRFLGQFVIMLSMLSVLPLSALLRTRKLKLELLRSLLMVSTTAGNFLALRHLRLDQTVSVVFMAPLIVALLAGPLLGEWVGWRRLIAVFTGFIGVLIVVHPGVGALHPAFLLAFGAMLAYAFFMLLTRYLAAYDAPLVMLFYSVLLGAFALAPFAIWQWVWPHTLGEWAILSILGVLGGTGHYLFIHAYRLAPASTVAPFIYMQLLTMVMFGFAVFGDLPDVWTLVGAGVIVASGIYLLHRERSLREEVAGVDPI